MKWLVASVLFSLSTVHATARWDFALEDGFGEGLAGLRFDRANPIYSLAMREKITLKSEGAGSAFVRGAADLFFPTPSRKKPADFEISWDADMNYHLFLRVGGRDNYEEFGTLTTQPSLLKFSAGFLSAENRIMDIYEVEVTAGGDVISAADRDTGSESTAVRYLEEERVEGAIFIPALEEGSEIERVASLVAETSSRKWRLQREIKAGMAPMFRDALDEDGFFTDLDKGDSIGALQRLWVLAMMRAGKAEWRDDEELKLRIYRGMRNYAVMQAKKPNSWPGGAFHVPSTFLGAWIEMLPDLERDQTDVRYADIIWEMRMAGRVVADQAWWFPVRAGDDQADPLDPDHFRQRGSHYMVANFLPYRSLVEYAVFLGDQRYLEHIARTAKRSLHERVHPYEPEKGFWTEGLMPDSNVTAHGRQAYPFGYGKDWLEGMITLAGQLKDGPYAFQGEDLDLMAEMILDGLQWFTYRNQQDYSVLGRHNLYPASGRGGNKALARLSRRLLAVGGDDLTRREALEELNSRMESDVEFNGSRYFWNTENYIHRGENFAVFLNINSTRSAGPEMVKPWSEGNFHFANGVTLVHIDGGEYRNARGAMNLRALPGITAMLSDEPAPYVRTWEGIRGTEDFAGGLSDGRSGLAAFVSSQDLEPTRALKAWFFHGNIMVCLGAGIQSADPDARIVTTMNQTEWRTDVHGLGQGLEWILGQDEPFERKFTSAERPVFWHNRVGYLVIDGDASLVASERPTGWLDISEVNRSRSASEEPVPIIHLFLSHDGENASTYAYGVYLDIEPDAIDGIRSGPGWEMIENSSAVQAVRFDDGPIQIVFRKPGAITLGDWEIESDTELLVMMEQDGPNHWQIYYQDPLHRPEAGHANLRIRSNQATADLVLDFPGDLMTGAPATVSWHRP